jgi:sugar phosphate isomerase/epimerase
MDRRRFLQAGALAGACAALPATAATPSAPPGPRYRLALAAYSMRKYLDLKNGTMDLSQFLDKCREWDVDGAELTEYFFKKPVTSAEVMALKRKALALGLDVTGTPIGNTFTHPPGEARDREVAKMKAWIDVSADLGSPAIRIFAGNTPKGGDEAQARGWVVECIQACLDHAAKRGVILALENHGGVVAKAEGLLDIVSKVKSEWLGVNLDSGNFHVEDPYAELEKIAHLAVTAQFKAEISVAGKKQQADYARLVGIMRKAGYKGYLTLEYEAAEEPLEGIPKQLEALRKAIG